MWNVEKIVNKGDYKYAIVRDHPNRTKNNYVLLHRVIVENHIGRVLTNDEIVHHKDENKSNNDISNLEIMDIITHGRLHNATGRTMVNLTCPNCSNSFIRERRQTHLVKGGNPSCCSRRCRGKLYNK